MTPDTKARLIRAYRAACTAADTARSATDTALEVLLSRPPANQRATADHLWCLLDTQRATNAACAALAVQLHQADARIRSFDAWADRDTPAWRWLLRTIEQEAPQRAIQL